MESDAAGELQRRFPDLVRDGSRLCAKCRKLEWNAGQETEYAFLEDCWCTTCVMVQDAKTWGGICFPLGRIGTWTPESCSSCGFLHDAARNTKFISRIWREDHIMSHAEFLEDFEFLVVSTDGKEVKMDPSDICSYRSQGFSWVCDFRALDVHDEPFENLLATRLTPKIDYTLLIALIKESDRLVPAMARQRTEQGKQSELPTMLIECSNRKLLYSDVSEPYVALSYVWGGTAHEDIEGQSLPARCPRVIDDALEVVTALGYRYLWVDKYCISNDPKEKQLQIANMHKIYQHADFTNVAAAGTDADQAYQE